MPRAGGLEVTRSSALQVVDAVRGGREQEEEDAERAGRLVQTL